MLETEKALLQSRTFWAALLALVAVIAQATHNPLVYAWASDPQTPTLILNAVVAVSSVLAMLFRYLASQKIGSIQPSASKGPKAGGPIPPSGQGSKP